jgi:GT2 family glycosyltransferase
MIDVIVIDNNNGQDESILVAKRLMEKYDNILEYFPMEQNSITKSYNFAIDYFLDSDEYDYLSFYCADWVYSDGAFKEMVKCLSQNEAYGSATALSNYCATSEGYFEDDQLSYLRSLTSTLKPEFLYKTCDEIGKSIVKYNSGEVEESEFFCIGFLCKRRMIEETGKFDERITSMNDVAYSLQAFKRGWESIVCLGAYIHHLDMHASWKKRPRSEHILAEKEDRELIAKDERYSPNENLLNHKFWDLLYDKYYKV